MTAYAGMMGNCRRVNENGNPDSSVVILNEHLGRYITWCFPGPVSNFILRMYRVKLISSANTPLHIAGGLQLRIIIYLAFIFNISDAGGTLRM